jgi:hypothetical protein
MHPDDVALAARLSTTTAAANGTNKTTAGVGSGGGAGGNKGKGIRRRVGGRGGDRGGANDLLDGLREGSGGGGGAGGSEYEVLDDSGLLLKLPYDLISPFARQVETVLWLRLWLWCGCCAGWCSML